MDPIISCCGMRCDLCFAFQPNIDSHPENRQIISDGWHKYFGFRIPPEDIHCMGCYTGGEATLDNECAVHPCVSSRGLANCAQCEEYSCEKLENILVTFEDMQSKFENPIPPEDRRRFIFPYENKDRLETIRQR